MVSPQYSNLFFTATYWCCGAAYFRDLYKASIPSLIRMSVAGADSICQISYSISNEELNRRFRGDRLNDQRLCEEGDPFNAWTMHPGSNDVHNKLILCPHTLSAAPAILQALIAKWKDNVKRLDNLLHTLMPNLVPLFGSRECLSLLSDYVIRQCALVQQPI